MREMKWKGGGYKKQKTGRDKHVQQNRRHNRNKRQERQIRDKEQMKNE